MPGKEPQFNFSKPEDQKRFDALSKEEKDKISDESWGEAEGMKRYVDRGLSNDYNDAEKEIEERQKIEDIVSKIRDKYKINTPSTMFELGDKLEDLRAVFGSLENVNEKRILDVGCGSCSGTFETDGFNMLDRKRGIEERRAFEPWLCRALVELGAKPVGVDIGNLEGEEFEHYRIDLSKSGALDFLPDKSFDGINMRLFLNSPHLENMTNQEKRKSIKQEIENQMKRLLKDDGKIIEFDTKINS